MGVCKAAKDRKDFCIRQSLGEDPGLFRPHPCPLCSIPLFFMHFHPPPRFHTSHVNTYKALQRGKKGEKRAKNAVRKKRPPPCMLLAARLDGLADGSIALASYQVSRDWFRKLTVVPENIVPLGYVGEGMEKAVFIFSDAGEKEIGEDRGKKTVRYFMETALITVDKGMSCTYRNFGFPVTAGDCFIKEIPGSKDGDFGIFLACDEEEEDGWLVPRKGRAWVQARSWDMYCSPIFRYNGAIRADWSPAYKDFVIRGKDMVRFKVFVATNPAVMNLEGYDTLIDITRENDVFKLTFSNGDYEFKTLVSRSTRDRGYVVTVE